LLQRTDTEGAGELFSAETLHGGEQVQGEFAVEVRCGIIYVFAEWDKSASWLCADYNFATGRAVQWANELLDLLVGGGVFRWIEFFC
jgi:hypothetical protein